MPKDIRLAWHPCFKPVMSSKQSSSRPKLLVGSAFASRSGRDRDASGDNFASPVLRGWAEPRADEHGADLGLPACVNVKPFDINQESGMNTLRELLRNRRQFAALLILSGLLVAAALYWGLPALGGNDETGEAAAQTSCH